MAEHWSRLAEGYTLNEFGHQQLKRLASKYQASEIMDAMVVATDQYLKLEVGKATQESVEPAWKKISGICNINRVAVEKPYIRDLLYIRGILKNRVGLQAFGVMELLEEAHLGGMSIPDLRRAARECRSWWSFEDMLKKSA